MYKHAEKSPENYLEYRNKMRSLQLELEKNKGTMNEKYVKIESKSENF